MAIKYQGNARVRLAHLQTLCRDFVLFRMKHGESVTEYFIRVMMVSNDMRNCGKVLSYVKVVEKISRTQRILITSYVPSRSPKTSTIYSLMHCKAHLSFININLKKLLLECRSKSWKYNLMSMAEETEETLEKGEEVVEGRLTKHLWNVSSVTNWDIFRMNIHN